MHSIIEMAKEAKKASFSMAQSSLAQRNGAIAALIKNLHENEKFILHANHQDIALAQSQGLNDALVERLSLKNRLKDIAQDLESVIALSDPLGEVFETQELANGLKLEKWRTPIGVLGVIYESRPNVTFDITALAIKSGNSAVLRGGSETRHTNQALHKLIQASLKTAQLPTEAIQLVMNSDRAEVKTMLQLYDSIDLIIPRGSAQLQQFCREHSRIPVITGGVGICHLFVDESADLERSLEVISNAKVQRPTVCNALGTLLVHERIAHHYIPAIVRHLSQQGVTFRLDAKAWNLFQDPVCTLAGPQDWDTEWLSLVLGIKVVTSLAEAIEHIERHSSRHSDGILTENQLNAKKFIQAVDSAAVYVNASTRFTDGAQFGMGAEVAVSTQKLHARGPMGLKELTSYKWVIQGNYQFRS